MRMARSRPSGKNTGKAPGGRWRAGAPPRPWQALPWDKRSRMLYAPETPSLQRLATKCRSGSASPRLPGFAARDTHPFARVRAADLLSRREEDSRCNKYRGAVLKNDIRRVGSEAQGGGVGNGLAGIIEDEHCLLFRMVIVPAPREVHHHCIGGCVHSNYRAMVAKCFGPWLRRDAIRDILLESSA